MVPSMPASSTKPAGAALRTFFRIAEAWDLTSEEQIAILGIPEPAIFFHWRKEPDKASLPADVLERLSHVFAIYRSLQLLLPDERAADAWIKKPNAASLFGGRSALDIVLCSGAADLTLVRRYLDGQQGLALGGED
jgi:hypothetical protein